MRYSVNTSSCICFLFVCLFVFVGGGASRMGPRGGLDTV